MIFFSNINITAELLIHGAYAYLKSLALFLINSAFLKQLEIVSNSFNQIECCNFLPALPKQVFLLFFLRTACFLRVQQFIEVCFGFEIFFLIFFQSIKIPFFHYFLELCCELVGW